jgi:hypothetical protein
VSRGFGRAERLDTRPSPVRRSCAHSGSVVEPSSAPIHIESTHLSHIHSCHYLELTSLLVFPLFRRLLRLRFLGMFTTAKSDAVFAPGLLPLSLSWPILTPHRFRWAALLDLPRHNSQSVSQSADDDIRRLVMLLLAHLHCTSEHSLERSPPVTEL